VFAIYYKVFDISTHGLLKTFFIFRTICVLRNLVHHSHTSKKSLVVKSLQDQVVRVATRFGGKKSEVRSRKSELVNGHWGLGLGTWEFCVAKRFFKKKSEVRSQKSE
jgi:hypothetical protein